MVFQFNSNSSNIIPDVTVFRVDASMLRHENVTLEDTRAAIGSGESARYCAIYLIKTS